MTLARVRFERRLLAACRWHAATAVAFPQKRDPTRSASSSRTTQVRDDFFMLRMKKSSLTCSAAPRFKTVTASLGHGFVPPTWKLIHRVHMTRKTSFCPLGQKLVFSSEACLRHGKRRFAPGRCFAEKYLRKCVARFPSHRAKHDPSRRLCRPFTSRLRDPSRCALRKPS